VQHIDEYVNKTLQVQYMRANMALVAQVRRRCTRVAHTYGYQEPALFDTSILDNIQYGLVDVPYARVIDAAKAANIHTFVTSLPEVR
jgi:ATP-binding cassette subfamily B (MDR/TAP) protein 1